MMAGDKIQWPQWPPYYVGKYGISNLWKFKHVERLPADLHSALREWPMGRCCAGDVLDSQGVRKEIRVPLEALAEPDAVLEQSSESRIAGEGPDYLALVQEYLVGTFQIVENTIESLVLELPRKTLPELLLRRIRFCPLNLPLNHQDSVQPRLMENRCRCHISVQAKDFRLII